MTEASITADISIEAYDKICRDIRDQPKWRSDSNMDCDYYDGAQTSAEVIERLKAAGIPPQDSNLIKPTINAVLGLEARSRTDYRVTADDESQAEIAEGLSAKMKEAETESRADRSMSDAYSSMIRAGIGWVEVSREFDLLKYPYRVREVHRNEIYWDWSSREPDLSDARYLRRDKWIDRLQAARMFPGQAEIITNSWKAWKGMDVYEGCDTGLARAYEIEQAWSRNQEDYLNRNSGMVRLSELWYRHFEDAYVLVLPDGKVIEYRADNPYHQTVVAEGLVQIQKSVITKMRVSIWLGPHKLMDVPSPLPHSDFPYVPFWCFRKDRSRAPYGLIRDMRGPQDQIIDLDILLYEVLNSVKIEIDNDALDLSQNSYQELANNISSLRSMTILNSQRRNANGFRVIREHQLAAQVFQLVQERKRRIEEVGGVYRAMLGAHTSATSGIAINNLVEQGSTVLAEPNDNFRYARRLVGQQLLALIKDDMIGRPAQIAIQQGNKRKVIYFNRQLDDGSVHNDVASAMVKVVLEDIPATPTFRAQQLQAMSQIVQAAPPQFQAVLYPVMLELSDVPNRHELAHQLRQVAGIDDNPQLQAMQQQVQQMLQEAQGQIGELQQRLGEAEQQLKDKSRELDLKERTQAHKEDVDGAKLQLEAEKIAERHIGNTLSA
jgi:hypothetical protein